MDQQPTCGQGLAEHAVLPEKFADLIGAVAENLEIHLSALDPSVKRSRPEFDAYVALATEHREIESRLPKNRRLKRNPGRKPLCNRRVLTA